MNLRLYLPSPFRRRSAPNSLTASLRRAALLHWHREPWPSTCGGCLHSRHNEGFQTESGEFGVFFFSPSPFLATPRIDHEYTAGPGPKLILVPSMSSCRGRKTRTNPPRKKTPTPRTKPLLESINSNLHPRTKEPRHRPVHR